MGRGRRRPMFIPAEPAAPAVSLADPLVEQADDPALTPDPAVSLAGPPAEQADGPPAKQADDPAPAELADPDEAAKVSESRLIVLRRRHKELYEARVAITTELDLVGQEIIAEVKKREEDGMETKSSLSAPSPSTASNLRTAGDLYGLKSSDPEGDLYGLECSDPEEEKEEDERQEHEMSISKQQPALSAPSLPPASHPANLWTKDDYLSTAGELNLAPGEQEMAKLKCSDAEEEKKEEEEDEMPISKQQIENPTNSSLPDPSLSLASHSIASELNQPQFAMHDLDQPRAANYMVSHQKIDGAVSKEIESLYEELMTTTDEDELCLTDGDEDKVNKGKSVTKRQIEKLCEDLEDMFTYLTLYIKPAAPLRELRETTEDDADEVLPLPIHAISEQFEDLRRHISKLRLELLPFKESYEEEQAKPDSYEGLDEEEKARKKIAREEKFFDTYRRSIEYSYRRVVFEQQTTISSMHFTHWTPGQMLPNYAEEEGISLQVFSFKIVEINGILSWPLQVYGAVAARDNSDRKRNIIFERLRDQCQEIFPNDPYLRLTGPSRAIMALSLVSFEVELILKGATESEDRALMNIREEYIRGTVDTIVFRNCLCTAELRVEELSRSVQATFLGVRVVDGPCPFEYGGRIFCSSPPREVAQMDEKAIAHFVVEECFQVVLLDSRHCVHGKMPIGNDGCLDLSRRFVSVELQKENYQQFKECLKVVIEAFSEYGEIVAEAHVRIRPRTCNISQHICDLGGSKVEITIAWSAIVRTDLC